MSFTQSFSVLQSPTNPAIVVLEDTSTGTNLSITSRRIYIQDYNGNYLVPDGVTTDYIVWPLATNPISLNILTQDTAVNIRVNWVNSLNVELYTLNNNYCLVEFNKQFLYYLIQLQSLTYNVIQDTNYWGNVAIFWTNIIGAINSVEIGNDIYASQVCLNRATFMQSQQSYYF
jgi:hypothetical protein